MFILCGLPKILSAVNAWRCQDSSYFSKIFLFFNCITQQKSTFFPPSLLRVGGQREQSKDDPAAIDPMLPAWALSNSFEG